mgnify:FL=1
MEVVEVSSGDDAGHAILYIDCGVTIFSEIIFLKMEPAVMASGHMNPQSSFSHVHS